MHFRILLLYCIFQRQIKSVLPLWIMHDPIFVDQMCGSYLIAQLQATDTFLIAGINAQIPFLTNAIRKQDLQHFWWVYSWKWHLNTWIQVLSWRTHQRKPGQWEMLFDQKMNVQIQANRVDGRCKLNRIWMFKFKLSLALHHHGLNCHIWNLWYRLQQHEFGGFYFSSLLNTSFLIIPYIYKTKML